MKIGDVIGNYEILDHIDSGGMGHVYTVIKDGKHYALKTCRDKDQEYLKRFKREVRLMKSLTNSNVVEIIDDNLDCDDPYFVMTLCDNSLEEAVELGLTEEDQFKYVLQLCTGIKSLHEGGIIHRDIKPSNALILNNEIKVADLGLGKFIDRDSTILTSTRDTTMGTFDYIAPEIYDQGKGRDADERSDIYSIGKLIYFVFSEGESPLFVNATKVKADIYSVIYRCTKDEPNDRYQKVSEIINDLYICKNSRNLVVTIDDIIATRKTGLSDIDLSEKLFS